MISVCALLHLSLAHLLWCCVMRLFLLLRAIVIGISFHATFALSLYRHQSPDQDTTLALKSKPLTRLDICKGRRHDGTAPIGSQQAPTIVTHLVARQNRLLHVGRMGLSEWLGLALHSTGNCTCITASLERLGWPAQPAWFGPICGPGSIATASSTPFLHPHPL
jgi:hypothetical protein